MQSELQKKYFVGATKPGSWSSVYTYKPQSSEIYEVRGEIFATLELTGPKTFNVATAGNLLLDHLHESYFESEAETPLLALEEAVLATQRRLMKLLQNDDAGADGIEVDLTTMVLSGGVLYMAKMGQGTIHLLRDGNLVEISSVLRDSLGSGIIKSGSTLVKRADVILIGTSGITDELTQDELLDTAVDFTDDILKKRSFEDESKVAMLIIGYKIDRTEARAEAALAKGEKPLTLSEKRKQHELMSNDDSDEDEKEDDEQDEDYDEEESGPSIVDKAKVGFKNLKETIVSKVSEIKENINSKRASKQVDEESDESPTPENSEKKSEHSKDLENLPTYQVILFNIRNGILKLWKSLVSVVWENWLGMGGDGIYLKGANRSKNWRMIVVVIVVAIGILYFSVKSISEANEYRALLDEGRKNIDTAVTLIEEVESVADIIAGASNNDERKQSVLAKLDQAETTLNLSKDIEELSEDYNNNLAKINSLRDLLNKIIAEINPEEIVDVAGIFPGADPSDITIAGNKIFISDREYGKIYSLNYGSSDLVELVDGLEKPRSITADDNNDIVVLDENPENRLATVNSENGNVNRHAGTSEFRLGSVPQIEFVNIFGGRVYAIDQNINSVIVLQRSGTAYGIPEKRFELPQLSTGNDLHVADLKIYFLADLKQGMFRLLSDQDDTPVLLGLKQGEDLFNANAIFVDAVHVYIADPNNKRILVFDKGVQQMSLVAQYVYRGEGNVFGEIKEIVADRVAGKLFVLDGTKILELKLSKLEEF